MGIRLVNKTSSTGHNLDMLRSLVLAFTCTLLAQEPLRLPREHRDYGLPNANATWLPYSEDAEHPCNEIWRAMYLTRCTPRHVAGALPREHRDPQKFFVPGWYFAKRTGTESDQRLFGGDGRQLPVEGFSATASQELGRLLRQVEGDVLRELKSRPRAAVWFQHDLLRLARRLIDTKQNPSLLKPLLRCAQRVALPRATLQSDALQTASPTQIATELAGFDLTDSVEIQRRSSRLFDAEYVQLWSSVYLTTPGKSPQATVAWLTGSEARPPLPLHSTALLVQGVVAVDDAGAPCATQLILEARTQRLVNTKPLAFDNRTTTRDGVDFAIWSLPRAAVRDYDGGTTAVACTDFRSIDMESQDLFRDYGTRKHTTYAAQCTLCHRRSETPDEAIAGFSALRRSSEPRPAEPGERKAQAEREMLRFLDKLASK